MSTFWFIIRRYFDEKVLGIFSVTHGGIGIVVWHEILILDSGMLHNIVFTTIDTYLHFILNDEIENVKVL